MDSQEGSKSNDERPERVDLTGYRLVTTKPPPAPEGDIHVTASGNPMIYLRIVRELLEEKKMEKLVLRGSNSAVNVVIHTVELCRYKLDMPVHFELKIGSTPVMTKYVPKASHQDQGLKDIEIERPVYYLHAHLSTKESLVDKKSCGYLAPVPQSEKDSIKDTPFETNLTRNFYYPRSGRHVRNGGGRPRRSSQGSGRNPNASQEDGPNGPRGPRRRRRSRGRRPSQESVRGDNNNNKNDGPQPSQSRRSSNGNGPAHESG